MLCLLRRYNVGKNELTVTFLFNFLYTMVFSVSNDACIAAQGPAFALSIIHIVHSSSCLFVHVKSGYSLLFKQNIRPCVAYRVQV